jgi:hypothetical protein
VVVSHIYLDREGASIETIAGLQPLQWKNSAQAASGPEAADYETVSNYIPEAGETKAHTYHWLHTFRRLGHLKTGTGTLTSDYLAALAFDKNGVVSYVVYNFTGQALAVRFSDGHTVNATPYGFTVTKN